MLASKGDLFQHKGVCFLTVLWLSFNGFSCVRIILSKILACQLTKNISWKPRSSTLRICEYVWNMCNINRFMISNMRFRLIRYDFYFPNFILQMVCVFCHINAGLLLSLYFNVVMIRTRLFYGPKSFSSERRPNK